MIKYPIINEHYLDMSKTKLSYEEHLNELYSVEECKEKTEHCWAGKDKNHGDKIDAWNLAMEAKYGTILKKYDPIAFQVGFNDWVKN